MDDLHAPRVNGKPLPDRYGVRISREPPSILEEMTISLASLAPVTAIRPPPPMVAWLTERDERGEYHAIERLPWDAVITGYAAGWRVEFSHGRLVMVRRRARVREPER